MEPAILKHMMPAGPGREPIEGGFIGAASSPATTHQPDDEIGVEPEPLQERHRHALMTMATKDEDTNHHKCAENNLPHISRP
jgi:hypothetical protein